MHVLFVVMFYHRLYRIFNLYSNSINNILQSLPYTTCCFVHQQKIIYLVGQDTKSKNLISGRMHHIALMTKIIPWTGQL